MSKRKSISKSLRFEIFTRDGFKCHYCGRQSDTVVLEVDHVIPVARGGTNEPDNLLTSCFDCNHGKGAKPIVQEQLSEEDRLRIAQERQEMIRTAELARAAAAANDEFRQEICNFWCECTKQESMNKRDLGLLCSFAKQHGVELLFEWIRIASDKFTWGHDGRRMKYLCGIRRNFIADSQEP